MVVFKNVSYENFLFETESKRIICYGAGGTLNDFLISNRARIIVTNKIDYIIDRDNSRIDREVSIGVRNIPVMTIAGFASQNIDFSRYVFIMCLADKYISEALHILDNIEIFNDTVCYYGLSALLWGREVYPPQKNFLPPPDKAYSIPKTIHYCWFGNGPMSQTEKQCIDSWKTYCPDYNIVLWNEDNYNIETTPLYVRQAYEAGKYAFVSDYIRLDIIYKYGGIYLDTDVELFRSLDVFLSYKSFFAFESSNLVATGLGFASIAANPIIEDIQNIYSNVFFRHDDGTVNLTSCPEYTTELFRYKGIRIDNSLQFFDDNLILPSEYFCPKNQRSMLYELTANTVADHKFSLSWFETYDREKWVDAGKNVAEINDRLLEDWKRSILDG